MLNREEIEGRCGTCTSAKPLPVYEIMKINIHPEANQVFTHTCKRFTMLTSAEKKPITNCYSSLRLLEACNLSY